MRSLFIAAGLAQAHGEVCVGSCSESATLLQRPGRERRMGTTATSDARRSSPVDFRSIHNSAVQLLRQGTTPEVVTFSQESLRQIAGPVKQAILDAHQSDAKRLQDQFPQFQKVLDHYQGYKTRILHERGENSHRSANHTSCRNGQAQNCHALRECREEQNVLWTEYLGKAEYFELTLKMACDHPFKDVTKFSVSTFASSLGTVNGGGEGVITSWQSHKEKMDECDALEKTHKEMKEKCDDEQDKLEVAVCANHRLHTVSRTEVRHEWALVSDSWQALVANVGEEEALRKKEYLALQEVECLLENIHERGGQPCSEEKDEAGSDEADKVISHCRGTEVDLGNWTIAIPQPPAAPAIPADRAYPCSAAYVTEHYDALRSPCHGLQACNDCGPQDEEQSGDEYQEAHGEEQEEQEEQVVTDGYAPAEQEEQEQEQQHEAQGEAQEEQVEQGQEEEHVVTGGSAPEEATKCDCPVSKPCRHDNVGDNTCHAKQDLHGKQVCPAGTTECSPEQEGAEEATEHEGGGEEEQGAAPHDGRPCTEEGAARTTPPSLSGGCQRCTCAAGKWQCACSMRHRKDINDLTDAEFAKFAAAVNKLKADGTWLNITMVHMMSNGEHKAHSHSLLQKGSKISHHKKRHAVSRRVAFEASQKRNKRVHEASHKAYPYGSPPPPPPAYGSPPPPAPPPPNPPPVYQTEEDAQSGTGESPTAQAPAERDEEEYVVTGGSAPEEGEAGYEETASEFGDEEESVSHNSMIFLPWHRKFMVEVENHLQLAMNDCSVTIPYWNWALELTHFEDSRIFGVDRLGSLNMEVKKQQSVGDVDELCVKDGAFGSKVDSSDFGHGTNELGVGFNDGKGSDCIMRAGSKPTNENYASVLVHLLEKHRDTNDFANMSLFLERDIHNSFHSAIGGNLADTADNATVRIGHMAGMTAPYDPIFFLHHGFLDFLWKQWQDTHLDASQRFHRRGDDMPRLLFDGETSVFPASDVSMSMDILDDDPATEQKEKVCVYYHERKTGDHACADDWERIRTCLAQVVQVERLHEVPRIKEMTSVGDVCSPLNPVQADLDRIWLETMSEMGMIKKTDVSDILKWESTLNGEISRETPTLDEADASQCDKTLCFSTKKLLEICDGLSPT